MSTAEEYFAAFAGFGLLALLVFHEPSVIALLNGINAFIIKVGNIGQQT